MRPPAAQNLFQEQTAALANPTGGRTQSGVPYTRAGEDPEMQAGADSDGSDSEIVTRSEDRIDQAPSQQEGSERGTQLRTDLASAQQSRARVTQWTMKEEPTANKFSLVVGLKLSDSEPTRFVVAQGLSRDWVTLPVRISANPTATPANGLEARVRCLDESTVRAQNGCAEVWILIQKNKEQILDLVLRRHETSALVRFGRKLSEGCVDSRASSKATSPCHLVQQIKSVIERDRQAGVLKTWEVRNGRAEFEYNLGVTCLRGPLMDPAELPWEESANRPDEAIWFCGTMAKEFSSQFTPLLVGNSSSGELLISLEKKATTQQPGNQSLPRTQWDEPDLSLEEAVLIHIMRSENQPTIEEFKLDPEVAAAVSPWSVPPGETSRSHPDRPSPEPVRPSTQSTRPPVQLVRPPVQPVGPTTQRPIGPSGGNAQRTDPSGSQVPPAQIEDQSGVRHWMMRIEPENPWTQIFMKDRSHRHIETAMRNMKTRADQWRILERFGAHFPESAQTVTDILNRFGVPSEFALLMVHESGFFYNSKFLIQVGADGEVGPWQLMYGTAKAFGLTGVFQAVPRKGRTDHGRFNVCDERADLVRSTEAVARKLKQMLSYFPHDPKLAVLSFNTGAGGVGRYAQVGSVSGRTPGEVAWRRIQRVGAIGRDYWKARELNAGIAARPQPGGYGYVERFVAAFHHYLEMPERPQASEPARAWRASDSPLRTRCSRWQGSRSSVEEDRDL